MAILHSLYSFPFPSKFYNLMWLESVTMSFNKRENKTQYADVIFSLAYTKEQNSYSCFYLFISTISNMSIISARGRWSPINLLLEYLVFCFIINLYSIMARCQKGGDALTIPNKLMKMTTCQGISSEMSMQYLDKVIQGCSTLYRIFSDWHWRWNINWPIKGLTDCI